MTADEIDRLRAALKDAEDRADLYANSRPVVEAARTLDREKVYAILYEQLDISTEVIIELAECGNLGAVTDAILALGVAQGSGDSAEYWRGQYDKLHAHIEQMRSALSSTNQATPEK